VVGLLVLGAGTAAVAEEPLHRGAMEVSITGAFSVSHNVTEKADLETVNGYHLIPHLGYVVTDQRGSGWLRGNFELLAEPTLIHLDSSSSSATVGGLAALARWLFAASPTVRPYLEAGLGILGGQVDLRQTNCDVNFIIQGGPGVMLFVSDRTAVTAGYRFQHISNAGQCTANIGINSSVFVLGVSYFFR
jgi:opacity protein-like surface antigen